MFTIEHEFDATVVTLIDEGQSALKEDITINAFEDCITIEQLDPRTDQVMTITLSMTQLRDLEAEYPLLAAHDAILATLEMDGELRWHIRITLCFLPGILNATDFPWWSRQFRYVLRHSGASPILPHVFGQSSPAKDTTMIRMTGSAGKSAQLGRLQLPR